MVEKLHLSIPPSSAQLIRSVGECMFGILLHLFLSSSLINFYTKSRQFGGQLLGSYFFFLKWVFHTLFIFSLKFNLFIWCPLPDFRQQEVFNLDNFYRDSYLLLLQDAFSEQFCSILTMMSFPTNEMWCSWYVCASCSLLFLQTNKWTDESESQYLNFHWWYMSLESFTWFWRKKKPIKRKIYRYRFMPIKRLIDLGRLQWLWFMFYYRKEMLIFLKIKFINISLEDIKGPSIMGLVQAIHSCMTYLRAALNAL